MCADFVLEFEQRIVRLPRGKVFFGGHLCRARLWNQSGRIPKPLPPQRPGKFALTAASVEEAADEPLLAGAPSPLPPLPPPAAVAAAAAAVDTEAAATAPAVVDEAGACVLFFMPSAFETAPSFFWAPVGLVCCYS